MPQDLYYQEACKAYRAEMDKRGPVTTAATKEEVATRGAMRLAEHDLLVAAEAVDPGLPESIRAKVLALAANYARAEGLYLGERAPFVLPDLRLARAEKLMVEEALARAGSMRLAAQLLDVTPARLRSALKRHGIVWPRPAEGVL
jgi:transcriptional regulator with GAF, ATPase, and Fis domain